jgi:ABC-type sugar transport system ATPase subunit
MLTAPIVRADASTIEAILEVRNLLKRFPGTVAVQNVSFAVGAGTIHALVGENGAGKSTIIKMLSGVYQPDGGEIVVDGAVVNLTSPHAAQAAGISTVYQERTLISNLSALENIFLGRELLTRHGAALGLADRRAMRKWVEDLCRDFEFEPRLLRRPVEELSALSRQIVEIIKALAFNSKLIILDEPNGGLSIHERRILFDQMRRLKGRGTAILWITHQLEELVDLADKVTVLRDGRLVGTLTGREATVDRVVPMMVGREVATIESFVASGKEGPVSKTSEEVLCVQDLGDGRYLRNLSFVLRKGEVLGIGGLQGAGANSLVESLIGARSIATGQIFLSGKQQHFRSTRQASAAGLAYVPNERKLQGILPLFSITQNISASSLWQLSRFGFVDRNRERGMARGYFDKLGIKARSVDDQIVRLSGGNQQKAIIARALAAKPRLIIFNEPTEGVDVGAKIEIYHLIRDYIRNGGAAIVKSSELVELLGVSDRVMVMRSGRFVGELPGLKANADQAHATDLQEQFMALAAASGGKS